jgi:hypothetical protein
MHILYDVCDKNVQEFIVCPSLDAVASHQIIAQSNPNSRRMINIDCQTEIEILKKVNVALENVLLE